MVSPRQMIVTQQEISISWTHHVVLLSERRTPRMIVHFIVALLKTKICRIKLPSYMFLDFGWKHSCCSWTPKTAMAQSNVDCDFLVFPIKIIFLELRSNFQVMLPPKEGMDTAKQRNAGQPRITSLTTRMPWFGAKRTKTMITEGLNLCSSIVSQKKDFIASTKQQKLSCPLRDTEVLTLWDIQKTAQLRGWTAQQSQTGSRKKKDCLKDFCGMGGVSPVQLSFTIPWPTHFPVFTC